MNVNRKPNFIESIIPVVSLVIFLFMTIVIYKGSPQIPIIFATVVAAVMAKKIGYSWDELEKGIINTIQMSMQAIIILMIIGTVIGAWILSGTVPAMIYYGLKILSPSIFLTATCIICGIVAIATGSSWTTAGTVGIALLGVGKGLQIPAPLVAGAIISGAYFGDKMSPLSDTTNLAPAMAGTTLFEHVKHMIYTTTPSLVITLTAYTIIGLRYGKQSLDYNGINAILNALQGNFNINIMLLIPPVIVIILVIKKVPAIPGLIMGTLLGVVFAFIFQRGTNMGSVVNVLHYGYESKTGIQAVDDLLSRGGLNSMMYTVSMILCAMSFGGIMEKAGFLQTIAEKMLKLAKSTGSLVLVTIVSCIFTNFVAGDQYLSIVIPGRMYKKAFDDRGLHPKNLSRCLEDAGTLTSPFVPWNTCGAFMWATLGVHPFAYLPFAFLNLINPIISIIYGYTGITMEKANKEEKIQEDTVVAGI